jgi:DNA-binding NarL/FixJ family response regulator
MAIARVLLADDDSLVRTAIRRVLADYPEVEVVGEAGTGVEAVSSVERLRPHIVIMDIRMPGMDGIAAAREIKDKYPETLIIGLSEYAYGYHADAMLKAGALAVYKKSDAPEELYAAIKKVVGSQDNSEPSR